MNEMAQNDEASWIGIRRNREARNDEMPGNGGGKDREQAMKGRSGS